ncbi:CopG family transcriptional regulator [Thermodesulfobacteriota bacterium]
MKKHKGDIITFKADAALSEAMRRVPNRSEFIRKAILAALDNVCPLCRGTGVFNPEQKAHWEEFVEDHCVRECEECHELHLVCSKGR